MRKNVELQIQALQMIEYMCGLIPAVLQLEDGETLRGMKKLTPDQTERYVLISVMRQSRDEFEAMNRDRANLEQMVKEGEEQRQLLEVELKREDNLLSDALTSNQNNGAETIFSIAAGIMSDAVLAGEGEDSSQKSNTEKTKKTDVVVVDSTDIQLQETTPIPKKAPEETEDRGRPKTPKKTQNTEEARPKTAKKEERAKTPKRPTRPTKEELDAATPKAEGEEKTERPASRKNSVKRPPSQVKESKKLGPVRKPSVPGSENSSDKNVAGDLNGPRRKNLNDVHAHLVGRDGVNSADVRSRAEYLRQQRDKLLELKRAERIKRINETTTKEATERPRTAQAARGAMNKQDDVQKAINERLKSEVLNMD